MKTTTILLQVLMFVFIIGLDSCYTGSGQEEVASENDSFPEILLQSTMEVFNTLPSPGTTADLIFKAGVKFDERILNPVKNVPYYETSKSMAINLGVYCADLSFTSLFDQKQLTMEYLSAVKTLTDGLGLMHLISKNDIIKLEDNLYNKDSIKILTEQVFMNSGNFLNENNRPEIALMVEVGGWIEGMYIAMQLAKQSGHINKELVDRVVEQYESLLLVIKSLDNFKKLKGIPEILQDMQKLKLIYDKMIVLSNSKDNSKTPNLAKDAKVKVTPEVFLELYHEIINIRNSYTQ